MNNVVAQPATVVKKHPQYILALDAAFFTERPDFVPGVSKFDIASFLQDTASYLVIRERDALEKNLNYRQILPYLIVSQRGADGVLRYLPYKRNPKGGEIKLHDKVSIGYGGHVDAPDVLWAERGALNLYETIVQAAMREFCEELYIVLGDGIFTMADAIVTFTGLFIADSSNDVNPYHVAVVMNIELPPGIVLESAEEELESLPVQTAQEILDNPKYDIESWSRMILEKVVSEVAA